MGRARGHDGERGRWGSDSFTLGTVSVPPQGDGCGAAAGYPVHPLGRLEQNPAAVRACLLLVERGEEGLVEEIREQDGL